MSGSTGASGTMASLREMVNSVSLLPGPSEVVQFVATMLCAVTCAASSRHAARHLRM